MTTITKFNIYILFGITGLLFSCDSPNNNVPLSEKVDKEVNNNNNNNNNNNTPFNDSNIEIELSIEHGDSLRSLGLCWENQVYVIIRNKRDSIIQFYEDWNSWGYYNTEFEITTYDSIYRIKRGARGGWWKNFSSYHSINPNQSLVLPFILTDTSCYKTNEKVIRGVQSGWVGMPTKGYDYAEIKAIYTVDKSMERNHFLSRDSTKYTKMWTGTLISKAVPIKIVDSNNYFLKN